MTTAVIEAGPVTVCGPGPVPADRAAIAVAGIDDEVVLLDDEPADVAGLWAEILHTSAAGARRLTLVCPTWWTADQRARVQSAAAAGDAEVTVLQRVQAVRCGRTSMSWAVVEIAGEVVVVSTADTDPVALARHPGADVEPDAIVRTVIGMAGIKAEVIVDAPPEVAGAAVLGREVTAGLRRRGLVADLADSRTWQAALDAPDAGIAEHVGVRVWPRRVAMWTAAAVAVLLGGIAMADFGRQPHDLPMTVLVEGRVGIQIPAGWSVHRVTEGPGSARVQVVSPSDPQVMIHLTQSGLGDGAVADTLRRVLREQPAGVFVDFDPSAVVADRSVVSYRELRPGREIRWVVFADGPVRIAVGCQSAPGLGEAIRRACEAATRSAHAVF